MRKKVGGDDCATGTGTPSREVMDGRSWGAGGVGVFTSRKSLGHSQASKNQKKRELRAPETTKSIRNKKEVGRQAVLTRKIESCKYNRLCVDSF